MQCYLFILILIGFFFPFFIPLQSVLPTYSLPDCNGVPLDHKLVEKLNMNNGVFIEVGANDGVHQSNTKLLEEVFGWTGILIEPAASVFQKLCANRPNSKCFQCALGSFSQDRKYIMGDFDGDLMASVGGKRLARVGKQKVLMRSLQSILNEVGLHHINFFSLDTEGYELDILKGIDFSKTTFDLMLVEIYPAEYEELVSLLLSKGYVLVENFSGYNLVTNPGWDGTHNDYLFIRQDQLERYSIPAFPLVSKDAN